MPGGPPGTRTQNRLIKSWRVARSLCASIDRCVHTCKDRCPSGSIVSAHVHDLGCKRGCTGLGGTACSLSVFPPSGRQDSNPLPAVYEILGTTLPAVVYPCPRVWVSTWVSGQAEAMVVAHAAHNRHRPAALLVRSPRSPRRVVLQWHGHCDLSAPSNAGHPVLGRSEHPYPLRWWWMDHGCPVPTWLQHSPPIHTRTAPRPA